MNDWTECTRKRLNNYQLLARTFATGKQRDDVEALGNDIAAALAELERLEAERDYLGQSAKVWMERSRTAAAKLNRSDEQIAELEAQVLALQLTLRDSVQERASIALANESKQ